MSWATDVYHGRITLAQAIGKGIAKAKAKFGVTVSDDQLDALQAKASNYSTKVRDLGAELIDEIPGVPTVVAELAASAAMAIIDAAIAGSIEAAKANN